MAYRCVHCSAIYEDASKELITGCSSCRSKFFFYIKAEKLKEILANNPQSPPEIELSEPEKKQIEEDVREITGIEDDETPVFLDFESVRVLKPGKYAIDLPKLFEMNKPRVYKLEDGKYIIDLNVMFDKKGE
ncbi:MAG: Zn-ribbon containing protein [Nanoarchaeota archaeon]